MTRLAGDFTRAREAIRGAWRAGFSLLEMLVVLAIIGILASMTLPALRGLNKSGSLNAATRQLLDDLALARSRAISGRTIVHVLFVPPTNNLPSDLADAPYRTYGMFAERTVGDQPGRPFYRYLGDWRDLPDGVLIARWKFEDDPDAPSYPFAVTDVPFPRTDDSNQLIPHFAFGPGGGLVQWRNVPRETDEWIDLVQGSVLSVRDNGGQVIHYDVKHLPLTNGLTRIRVDAFTGKAEVLRAAIQ